ncbi:hypothetical protein TrVE_jg4036 [Triparma verrucosa]|uniref:Uncharacterized protein n=1 Tax=Triparma verrucosa TaxID=1606542 RepID=A0A9W7C3F7_9STRA|nr:hypothetical protein TrVE_jg4036 [Triparma verrucosa]
MIESKYESRYMDVMAEVAEAEHTMKAREEKLKEIDQAVREAKKASEKAVDEKMELKIFSSPTSPKSLIQIPSLFNS